MRLIKGSSKSFIFISHEGRTYQPNTESIEPDINNCQVIGFSQGKEQRSAFRNLLKNNPYLRKTSFDELICYEISRKKEYFFLSEIRRRIKGEKV